MLDVLGTKPPNDAPSQDQSSKAAGIERLALSIGDLVYVCVCLLCGCMQMIPFVCCVYVLRMHSGQLPASHVAPVTPAAAVPAAVLSNP